MAIFTVKMRASQQGRHTSGAEKTVDESRLTKTVSALIRRAKEHELGQPDFINLKIEQQNPSQIVFLPALPVTDRRGNSIEETFRIMEEELEKLGVPQPKRQIERLTTLPPMRGAAVFDIISGERLDAPFDRGIRVTYMDEENAFSDGLMRKNPFREALVLSTKTAAAEGMVAELCISDDPNYLTGYIASAQNGYIRLSPMKQKGDSRGGRIFLFDSRKGRFEDAVRFLQEQPVLVTGMPERLFPTQDDCADVIRTNLESQKANGLHRRITVIDSPQKKKIRIGKKKLLLFSSNNYLDWAMNSTRRLKTAAAVLKWGCGSGGSRLTTGTQPLHMRLEAALSQFFETDDALFFSTGYAANVGILSALGKTVDVIFSDESNHASIIDGCRLAKADTVVYRHNDPVDLERKIRGCSFRSGLIVSDGVFSMGGDIVRLPEILTLGKKYGLLTMIDEAHSFGVLGKTGRGTAEHFGLKENADLIMGTLSKAAGAEGGFVCADAFLIDFLRNNARSFIFSTAPTPADTAAAAAALKRIQRHPERIRRLQRNMKLFEQALTDFGFDISVNSAVVPIPVGDEETALRASNRLRQLGFWIPAIRYPSVPRGKAILRAALTASHTEKELRAAAKALASVLIRE